MTTNAERAHILERALRAGAVGDPSAVDLFTDDVTAWTPVVAIGSLDDLRTEFANRDDAFADVDVTVTPLDVGGAYACAEWSMTMTHSGPLSLGEGRALDATGLRITVHGCTVAEFRGSRICSFRQYWDAASVAEQLGLVSGEK